MEEAYLEAIKRSYGFGFREGKFVHNKGVRLILEKATALNKSNRSYVSRARRDQQAPVVAPNPVLRPARKFMVNRAKSYEKKLGQHPSLAEVPKNSSESDLMIPVRNDHSIEADEIPFEKSHLYSVMIHKEPA